MRKHLRPLMKHLTHLREADDEGVSQAALVLDLPLHIGPEVLHKLAYAGRHQQKIKCLMWQPCMC